MLFEVTVWSQATWFTGLEDQAIDEPGMVATDGTLDCTCGDMARPLIFLTDSATASSTRPRQVDKPRLCTSTGTRSNEQLFTAREGARIMSMVPDGGG